MPPKRKSKATKSVSSSGRPTSRTFCPSPFLALPLWNRVMLNQSELGTAGHAGGHSVVSNRSSFPKSRLAPSIPFQMTTRRGAKTSSDHTSPAGPSSASSGSRRSSLNDITQYEDAPSDGEHARPAKRSRTSSNSGSPQTSNGSFHLHHSMNGSQVPDLQDPAPGATLTAPKPVAKRRRASDDSTQSSRTLSARQNGVLTRAHSDVSDQQPRKKKCKTTEMPPDPADQPPELTDASTAPNSPEHMLDVDGSQGLQNLLPANGDAPAKTSRRLPGRRRQPHSDINVEIDLRRQLNLKMSYRSLAKVQKALLEELSARATDNLEKDPDYHANCPGHKPLMDSLDQRRDSRLDEVNAARTYRMEQLERVRIAEESIHREQYIVRLCCIILAARSADCRQNRFQELQDDFLLQCYIRMKRIEREAKGDWADATDDEVGFPWLIEALVSNYTRIISFHLLTQMSLTMTLMIVSAQNMLRAAEPMLKLTECSVTNQCGGGSIKPELLLSRRPPTQMIQLKKSRAALRDSPALTALKPSFIITSLSLLKPCFRLKGHHRHSQKCQRCKSFQTKMPRYL